ncbi:glycosyl hydrolase 115 family protein [Sphingomonas aracearum]|uniref:glycosyl hydrolase 115 family protein n=1 Tax=Sphingomonas aracearum TaxID=2283317 RepID=UPI0015F07517|nr:glycosyl hydrolase 115 family protein [Sphingomonas aracearum]
MLFAALLALPAQAREAAPLVAFAPRAGGVVLAQSGRAATLLLDPADAPAVAHAADDLAGDLAAVSGARPAIATRLPAGGPVVLIGTLGHHRLLDALAAGGQLDVSHLSGAWESFVIATVRLPDRRRALAIVGSDRRGTAFGAYELSRAIGVSPWVWWADVAPARHGMLVVPAGTRRFGPPSVRYRGLFLNDEDWGLQPWAARTLDPARGNLGPESYRRIFQLLLRLRANTLWPAMHKVSAPFNADPANARLADEHGMVMSASHAEPMLRNNVGEWHGAPDAFNYATNPEGVAAYWRERVASNGAYENVWPLGMRGIHDSGMLGATTLPGRQALLNKVIADQRDLLRAANPDVTRVPQLFTPYKEVLDVYRAGLRVPDDVTLVWPDDNFGYLRQFPGPAERARGGGNGVYYHLSYLGAPLSYLWLGTTPPALIQEEMTRAFDAGARRFWMVNAGDIKPGEIGLERFFDLAWNMPAERRLTQRQWLDRWATRTFGTPAAGALLDEHFRLNFERRPEHLQWWLPGEKPRPSTWSGAEIDARLARFAALADATTRAGASIAGAQRDAWFELVDYPVLAAAAANRRAFAAERYAQVIEHDPHSARAAAGIARAADAEIKALTRRYNDEIAGGKWRGILAEEPADNQWRGFRLSPVVLPAASLAGDGPMPPAPPGPPAPQFVEAESAPASPGWRLVEGLGRGTGSLMAQPGASLTLRFTTTATTGLDLGLVPLFPHDGDGALHLDVALDGAPPSRIDLPRTAGDKAWSRAVLDNLLRVPLGPPLPAGAHRLTITARSSGVALDRLILTAR